MSTSTTDNVDLVQSSSNHIFGVGVGVFTIFFITLAFIIVWIISIPCTVDDKITYRLYLFIAWAIIVGVFALADREPQYSPSDTIRQVINMFMYINVNIQIVNRKIARIY